MNNRRRSDDLRRLPGLPSSTAGGKFTLRPTVREKASTSPPAESLPCSQLNRSSPSPLVPDRSRDCKQRGRRFSCAWASCNSMWSCRYPCSCRMVDPSPLKPCPVILPLHPIRSRVSRIVLLMMGFEGHGLPGRAIHFRLRADAAYPRLQASAWQAGRRAESAYSSVRLECSSGTLQGQIRCM